MPELSRFFGIIIRMRPEVGVRHHAPHIHARYQGDEASYGIDPAELLAGYLPNKQHRLVLEWIEIHKIELLEDWGLLNNGQLPNKIEPLE